MEGFLPCENGFWYEITNTGGMIDLVVDDYKFSSNFQQKLMVRVIVNGKCEKDQDHMSFMGTSSVSIDARAQGNTNEDETNKAGSCGKTGTGPGLEAESHLVSVKIEPGIDYDNYSCNDDGSLCENSDQGNQNNALSDTVINSEETKATCLEETSFGQCTDDNIEKRNDRNFVSKRKVVTKSARKRQKCIANKKPQVQLKSKLDVSNPSTDVQTTSGVEVKPVQDVVCKYCGKTFPSEKEFKAHRLYLGSGNEKYECDICPFKHRLKAYLLIHRSLEHRAELGDEHGPKGTSEGDKSFSCCICKKSILLMNGLKLHMRAHTDEHVFVCCVCGKKMNWMREFLKHCEEAHAGQQPRESEFRCNPCNKSYKSRKELNEHQKIHKITCSFCGEIFGNYSKRAIHLAKCHQEVAPQCPLCQQFCDNDLHLKNHLHHHRFHPKRQCSLCGEFFINLESHMMVSHGEGKTFACDQCPKMFSNKVRLRFHTRIHTGEKPFRCEVCSQDFRLNSTLRKHMRIHTKEKPYKCEVCGKGCSQSYNLKIHMRTHSNVKAFHCVYCGQGFNYNVSLQGHIKSKHAQEITKLEKTEIVECC